MSRTIRSKEERIAEIDKKIEHHQEIIRALEEKKAAIVKPHKRKERLTTKRVAKLASKAGLKPAEMMELLGLVEVENLDETQVDTVENNEEETKE